MALGCAAWPSALNADPIPTLYNTGVNDDYELLDDLAPDPHYKLVVNPDSDVIHPFVVKSDEFPIPPWLANGPDSKWLAVREGENANGINGNYTYRTSFDLTGFDLETLYIDMGWSVDNTGVNVLLNGEPLRDIDDNLMTIGAAGFGGWAYHTIESDQRFIPGINTLDFLVFNAGTQVNPIGLRVEFDADADPLDADEKPMVRTLFAVQGDNFVDTIPDLWQVIQDEPSVYPETVTVRAGQQVSFMVTASAGDAPLPRGRDRPVRQLHRESEQRRRISHQRGGHTDRVADRRTGCGPLCPHSRQRHRRTDLSAGERPVCRPGVQCRSGDHPIRRGRRLTGRALGQALGVVQGQTASIKRE